MVLRTQRGNEVAALFLSFKLDSFKQLLSNFNTPDFELIMVDSRRNLEVIATSQAVGDSVYGPFFFYALHVILNESFAAILLALPWKWTWTTRLLKRCF